MKATLISPTRVGLFELNLQTKSKCLDASDAIASEPMNC